MSQLIMIVLISILVLVHEAGHFIAARLCGVRVTRFGIGMPFGPEWKLFKWKNTNFYIHAFLFGGYVAFPDDMDNFTKEKKDDKKDDDEDEVLPSDSPELYENKTIFQKLFIVSAGVIMNAVFAILLVMFCAVIFKQLPTSYQELYVKAFANEANVNTQTLDYKTIKKSNIFSNIHEKNILKDDRIIKINNENIDSLYQLKFFSKHAKLFDGYAQENLVEKNIQELKRLNPNLKDNIEKDTLIKLPEPYPEEKLILNQNILKGLEKYKPQGIKLTEEQINLRDEIFKEKTYTTKAPTTIENIAYALSDTYKPLSVTVLRDNKEIEFDDIIVYSQTGLFGIQLSIKDIYMQTTTPKSVVVNSIKYCYDTTKLMLQGLCQLIIGKVSMGDMHGVIAVVKIGGDIIASKGILNGLLLTAMISLNLAIMNFLPIPALDGGHVMFLAIEKITGKKPTKEFSEKLNNFFFVLLIILMIAICYNDIFALVTKKF